MYDQATILFLTCESSLHAGAGERTGGIDLPIQREKSTNFPKIESSSFKGAIKESFRTKIGNGAVTQDMLNRVFGYDMNGDIHSAISFDDAKLLLFPVRSAKGVFAWITSARVLWRFAEDLKYLPNYPQIDFEGLNPNLKEDFIQLFPDSEIQLKGRAIFEEYLFNVQGYKNTDNSYDPPPKINLFDGKKTKLSDPGAAENLEVVTETLIDIDSPKLKEIDSQPTSNNIASVLASILFENSEYWKNKFEKHLVIVGDETFRDFVTLHTEVITRNKINPATGTAEGTGLFVEEYVPANSVFYAITGASKEFGKSEAPKLSSSDVLSFFNNNLPNIIQLGGNETIGKGILKINNYSTEQLISKIV